MTKKLAYFFKSPRRKNYHKSMVEFERFYKRVKRSGYIEELNKKMREYEKSPRDKTSFFCNN